VKFCSNNFVLDPYLFFVPTFQEANKFMALYAVSIALGHTLLCRMVKSGTLDDYLRNAAQRIAAQRNLVQNQLRPLQWHDPRMDLSTNRICNDIKYVVKELQRWETRPARREPLTTDMIMYQHMQTSAETPHSEDAAMFDWWVHGIYAGNRLHEWAQSNGKPIARNIDGTPTAFTIPDLRFFGENRRRFTRNYALAHPHLVVTIDVKWRFQKNGQHGEEKTFVRMRNHPALCAVSALLRIAQRWVDFNLPEDHPLAVFSSDGTPSGDVKYITDRHINTALRRAAKAVYNITAKKELERFSSHSIRVGACVALHAANISATNIQHALRWRSDSFWLYLRNLPCQAGHTSRAVVNFNVNCLNIVPTAVAA